MLLPFVRRRTASKMHLFPFRMFPFRMFPFQISPLQLFPCQRSSISPIYIISQRSLPLPLLLGPGDDDALGLKRRANSAALRRTPPRGGDTSARDPGSPRRRPSPRHRARCSSSPPYAAPNVSSAAPFTPPTSTAAGYAGYAGHAGYSW